MLSIIKRKASRPDLGKDGDKYAYDHPPIPVGTASRKPPSSSVSTSTFQAPQKRTAARAQSNALPDLRLSGFDVDKIMGAAAFRSSPTPLSDEEDEDEDDESESDGDGRRRREEEERMRRARLNGSTAYYTERVNNHSRPGSGSRTVSRRNQCGEEQAPVFAGGGSRLK